MLTKQQPKPPMTNNNQMLCVPAKTAKSSSPMTTKKHIPSGLFFSHAVRKHLIITMEITMEMRKEDDEIMACFPFSAMQIRDARNIHWRFKAGFHVPNQFQQVWQC
mmetsp:Transcript_31451/g.55356  ORF Transcript_31451/g.55356 Transcript_31451/m.55356 type:complete len:106 (+) Transcript_31451:372-689(+)